MASTIGTAPLRKKVEQQLKQLGVEACVPTQKLVKCWSDRKKVVDTVLFNNYVFVTTPATKYNTVLEMGNVVKFLKFGGEIASLSEQDILLVKQLAGLSAPVQITYQSLQKGDQVEFVSGCLVGRQGHIVAVNGGERIQVEVEQFKKRLTILKINNRFHVAHAHVFGK